MKVIALTGAGISKSAGIPTFEEVEGLKEKLSVDYKQKHPKKFAQAFEKLVNNCKDKIPTKAHRILADLDIPIITMNIDCLHQKAGSKVVYELHGNCENGNVVLYGQDILNKEEAINLIIKTAIDAKQHGEKANLLVIGSSMQTTFAIFLAWLAEERGMSVNYINENADEEVPKFFKDSLALI